MRVAENGKRVGGLRRWGALCARLSASEPPLSVPSCVVRRHRDVEYLPYDEALRLAAVAN